MFEFNHFSILIEDRYLLKDLSFILRFGDKMAIIGEEGNGKSTLLKCILGICDYANTTGVLHFHGNKVGYLPQKLDDEILDKTVFAYLFKNRNHYYEKINVLYKYLDELKLSDSKLGCEVKCLSGGERIKVALLKLLLEDSDILLLDEPTNDLDIASLEWLENFINRSKKIIIYVSHDEKLLSDTANVILHLEMIKHKTECRHTVLNLSYDEYVQGRLAQIERQRRIACKEKSNFEKKEQKLKQIMAKVEYQQSTISRSNPHGARLLKKKMHALKSQERRLSNFPRISVPDLEEEITFFFDDVSIPPLKTVIDISIPLLQMNGNVLSRDVNLLVKGGEHVVIVGENGIGKTTLIKQMYHELKKRNDIKVGYMPQDYDTLLHDFEYVLDFVSSSKSKEDITRARKYLGNMNFTKEEMTLKIASLSNGTIAKMFLIKFVLDKCNVLLLDEPTRNMSPLSNPVVRKMLREFQGVIISTSHDRKYIEEVGDIIYVLSKKGLDRSDLCSLFSAVED